jgi:hypothetical protein
VLIARNVFVVTMCAVAIVNYLVLTHFITQGRAVSSLFTVWVASPAVMFSVWLLIQQAQPSCCSFGSISYAAVLGDVLVLPAAAYIAALGWRASSSEMAAFWKSGWWMAIAFAVGLIGGICFHLMGGRSDSQSDILSERLHDSPLSWAHNIGVFPALLGALVCTLVPLLTVGSGRVWFFWALGIAVVGWGGLVVIDTVRMKLPTTSWWHFNPQWMDIEYDWSTLHLLR